MFFKGLIFLHREHVPWVPVEGVPEGGAVICLRYEIYKNSVSSIEAVMGMEEQIMCIEQWNIEQ